MKNCVEPVGAFGESRCIHAHGNAEDSGMCEACEDAAIEAREMRIVELRDALRQFVDQMPGQMWDYAVTQTVSAIVRAVNMDGLCRLCRCHNGCAPGCAMVRLREVID